MRILRMLHFLRVVFLGRCPKKKSSQIESQVLHPSQEDVVKSASRDFSVGLWVSDLDQLPIDSRYPW